VRRRGRAYEGICTQAGRDLFGPRDDVAAEMVLRGWALAAPNAPAQYRAYEEIAQPRDAGIWGAKIVNIR
jgi:endonuclease YncB( thermonuclease family)